MSRRRHTPEQIITALREAEVGLCERQNGGDGEPGVAAPVGVPPENEVKQKLVIFSDMLEEAILRCIRSSEALLLRGVKLRRPTHGRS